MNDGSSTVRTCSSTESGATAVIIGRAGSKGYPGKNAALLLDRPIVHYSIEHALDAKTVSRILVSTDCPQLSEAARSFPEVRIVDRLSALATDHATVDDAVRHAVTSTEDRSAIVVILYANVPIRPLRLIDDAVNLLIESAADSVQSYAPVGKHHPMWMSRIRDDVPTPYAGKVRAYRRQDLEPLYILDGGIIAVTREALEQIDPVNPHAFLGEDHRAIINPPHAVVDIDEPKDLLFAEACLRAVETHHPDQRHTA